MQSTWSFLLDGIWNSFKLPELIIADLCETVHKKKAKSADSYTSAQTVRANTRSPPALVPGGVF
jgi:hypothetical protein